MYAHVHHGSRRHMEKWFHWMVVRKLRWHLPYQRLAVNWRQQWRYCWMLLFRCSRLLSSEYNNTGRICGRRQWCMDHQWSDSDKICDSFTNSADNTVLPGGNWHTEYTEHLHRYFCHTIWWLHNHRQHQYPQIPRSILQFRQCNERFQQRLLQRCWLPVILRIFSL